jgi:hypothetical protein
MQSTMIPADSLGFSDRDLAIFQNPSGVHQERLAGRRQRDSLASSLEQFDAQLAFQIVDLLAERRLRNIKPVGRVSEVQFLGGSNKVFKMAELHGCSSLSSDQKTDLCFLVPDI